MGEAEDRYELLKENCSNLLRSLRGRADAMRSLAQYVAAEENDVAADALEGVLEGVERT